MKIFFPNTQPKPQALLTFLFHAVIPSTRSYTVPDPPGLFDGHVWPMYLKHRKEMEDCGVDVGKSAPNTNPSALELEFKELGDLIRGNFHCDDARCYFYSQVVILAYFG